MEPKKLQFSICNYTQNVIKLSTNTSHDVIRSLKPPYDQSNAAFKHVNNRDIQYSILTFESNSRKADYYIICFVGIIFNQTSVFSHIITHQLIKN